jgi:hypothetical protein
MPKRMAAEINRKVYSNYTHVVARCWDSASSTTYIDFEMTKELLAAVASK